MGDLYISCKAIDINIVKYTLSKGVTNYEYGLDSACSTGNIEIVKLILGSGVSQNIINRCIFNASQYGRSDIIKLVINSGVVN